MMHAIACGFAQAMLIYYLTKELILDNLETLAEPAVNIRLTITCLFCSLILHMALQDEL